MNVQLHLGDCLEVMATLPENSVDTCITDPPYGLEFMGKDWDAPWKDGKAGVNFNTSCKGKLGGFKQLPNNSRVNNLKCEICGKWKFSSNPCTCEKPKFPNARLMSMVAFQEWTLQWATEVYRVLKPGAIMLAFGGTRTYHRMVCAIEDAGFEIRDTIAWVYGSGFPKSHDISKSIDRVAKKGWDDLGKAIDNIQTDDIIQVWKRNCNTANIAVRKLKRNQTKVGDSTPKENTAHESVLLTVNLKKSYVSAIIAELSLSEAHLMLEVQPIAHRSAEQNTKQKISNVSFAEKGLQDQFQIQSTEQQAKNSNTITVLLNVREWLKENITRNPRVDEALRTYYGNPKSLSEGDINALCVELIDDLKRITLSQSKTFQNLDTTQQTECVSATSAIITEYTAEHLISFTVDTLKNKALDKAQGAQREVVGRKSVGVKNGAAGGSHEYGLTATEVNITAPSTPEAQLWHGWGTALKPAMELICVAMKPIDGTYVNNALTWGVAGLWIDGGRVGTEQTVTRGRNSGGVYDIGLNNPDFMQINQGRFPANLIHDGSDEVVGLFPSPHGAGYARQGKDMERKGNIYFTEGVAVNNGMRFGDSGSAARFFYCAKSSRRERNNGLDGYLTVKYNNDKSNNGGLSWKDVSTVAVQLLRKVTSDLAAVSFNIGESGESITALCPKDSLSTTLTAISKIIELKILHSLTLSLTNEYTVGVNYETANGGSPAESVESLRKWILTTTNGSMELARGASNVALQMLLRTKNADAWSQATNFHSTVKPLALMRYLARLTKTPTGGVVLDPFMGSGTTGIACVLEGREFIGIEREPEYIEIAEKRIAHYRLPILDDKWIPEVQE